MSGWWANVISKLTCGKKFEGKRHKNGFSPVVMPTREVSEVGSFEDFDLPRAADGQWNVPERRRSPFLSDCGIPAMIPFSVEQGEVMQRLRSKALEICKYNGVHIRDTARFRRLVLNNKEIPKKRIVAALHPSDANLVDISKTTSVDGLRPGKGKKKRRRNTLANTVPIVYEREPQNRARAI